METKTNRKPKIHVLPSTLSNKIAAGEVVERPASVVKELIENAIDAEAGKIRIILSRSGKESIQVIDDGEGMSNEDISLAFLRHATSKLYRDDDLERIETLGFRGEALPSIASVARIEICSRAKEDALGTKLIFEEGQVTKATKTACPIGTNISVKNLFYTTPARRNFLRNDNTELQKIISVLKRFVLAYPEISFELYHDDTQLLKFQENPIEERVKDVFGKDFFPYLLPIKESLGDIDLYGFISKPEKVRRTGDNQFLFLNGRPIQDKSLSHAVKQGYMNLIQPGDYPIYCLFLEMDAGLVDVNVHPSKQEVRFSNERSLYYFFMSSIRKQFNSPDTVPVLEEQQEKKPGLFLEKQDIGQEFRSRKKYMARSGTAQMSLAYFTPPVEKKPGQPYDSDQRSEPVDVDVQFWQIHKRYILAQIKSGMVIIDQHVAHERILFERMVKILKEGGHSYGQQLLFPQTLVLPVDDYLLFKEIKPFLEKIGFGIRLFSGSTIVIDAIPVDVKMGREAQIVTDIIDYYKENVASEFDRHEKMAAAFACKNAIKSGEELNLAKMHALVDQLFACEAPYYCPHGRPVVVTLSLEDIDRKFKRIN
jgi:DNA mismatch repair protein MutL